MTFECIQRRLAWLVAPLTALALVACGGGSGAGAAGDDDLTGFTQAASITVSASAPSLKSDGADSVTITAIVKDAGNRSMPNQTVSFATTDGGAQLDVVSGTTDAAGSATATLKVADRANRAIPITASTGSLSAGVSVDVAGTSLTLSGPSSIVLGAPTGYTVTLRDSAGNPIGNAAVTASARNPISPASIVTNGAGQATLTLTGSVAGGDTLTVKALGAAAALNLNVSGTQITFSNPSAGKEITVGAVEPLRITYVDNGAPVAGATVLFSATRGTLSAASTVTDASGNAEVSVSSASAGVSTLTAAVGGVQSTQRVEFVSKTPAKINLQASPANVPVNLSPTGTNASQLIAVVRDASDNPVKGQTVFFSAVADPSNGRIEPGSATTDSSGVASVAFFPGANSSGNNQIVTRATIAGTGLSADSTLTASAQALTVRVFTGNEVIKVNTTTNEVPWTASVTDSNGNPVVGATVQASVVGTGFYKGDYFWGGTSWVRRGETSADEPYYCISEDLNGNGRMDPSEDLNANGQLDPGEDADGDGQLDLHEDRDNDGKLEPVGIPSAVVAAADSKTDSNGEVSLGVRYGREYGGWTEVRLRVTITTVAGTEGVDERVFLLPVLGADVSSETVAPPGAPSPFGLIGYCFVAN